MINDWSARSLEFYLLSTWLKTGCVIEEERIRYHLYKTKIFVISKTTMVTLRYEILFYFNTINSSNLNNIVIFAQKYSMYKFWKNSKASKSEEIYSFNKICYYNKLKPLYYKFGSIINLYIELYRSLLLHFLAFKNLIKI